MLLYISLPRKVFSHSGQKIKQIIQLTANSSSWKRNRGSMVLSSIQ